MTDNNTLKKSLSLDELILEEDNKKKGEGAREEQSREDLRSIKSYEIPKPEVPGPVVSFLLPDHSLIPASRLAAGKSSSTNYRDSHKDIDEKLVRDDKFYVPRLDLNQPNMWEDVDLANRKHLTDAVAYETCLGNCCGVAGLKAGCCKLNPNDLEHVLGPVTSEWVLEIIDYLYKKTKVRYKREDIVIDYEEGMKLGQQFFNSHPVFFNKGSYPILRIQVFGSGFACKFLGLETGKCSIYEARPEMCRAYLCNYLISSFIVKKPGTKNTYYRVKR